MDIDGCLCIWANVYLLARAFDVKPRRGVTYSRRRYPENIYRPPRQENKRSFWEPASYDDLSARFNGVPSVAVTTLDVRSREFRLCTHFAPNSSPACVCSALYG